MRRWVAALFLCVLPLCSNAADTPPAAEKIAPRALSTALKAWTGDGDAMLKRHMVRVLVPYSRTLYYVDNGQERGLTALLVRDFEQHLNRRYRTDNRPITVYLIPTTRDKLLPNLLAGYGDIAAGNLTITEARQEQVDFVPQTDRRPVAEVVVAGPNAPKLASVDDLAGYTVHVRASSSYRESLVALNEKLQQAGRPPVMLKLVPDALEDEDLMEMANAGLVDLLVVDDWKAALWARILPKITVHDALVLRDDGHIGWAIRKDSPQLAAMIADFDRNNAAKYGNYQYRVRQATRSMRRIQDPTTTSDWKRFEQTIALFRRYGDRYDFDPLMLAAQGYQESQLDQSARSRVGAIGIMQLMPATGAQMKVGDIHVTEANIHAGAKYMDHLMSRYFPDAHFSEGNRPLFAFASYNAGPGNIARMRRLAAERGLDPDKWFNNVEVVTAEKIGQETTTYVRNIYKYYVSYRFTLEAQEARREAMRRLSEPAE